MCELEKSLLSDLGRANGSGSGGVGVDVSVSAAMTRANAECDEGPMRRGNESCVLYSCTPRTF
jgi:hypothetical protein